MCAMTLTKKSAEREYDKKLYSIALRYVRNHHDAEEIVQDTFLKIYKVIEKVHNLPREKIAPFIVICIKHTAFDLIEKKRKRVETVDLIYDDDGEEKEYEVADDSPLPDEIVISKERAVNLGRCIDSLSEKQRHIILLRYYYGLSEKEIADLMSMSESAVSSCVDRAKKSLRENSSRVGNTKTGRCDSACCHVDQFR